MSTQTNNLPLVAIAGRPNVGKSTLFNRILGRRKAIVQKETGTTRDRIYTTIEWNGKKFKLVDTGGFQFAKEESMDGAVDKQVLKALEEADLVLFLVDCIDGLTAVDERFSDILRKTGSDIFTIANKIDDHKGALQSSEFYHLGFDQLFGISAEHGDGVYELLDKIVSTLPEQHEMKEVSPYKFNLSIIGEPNVGKSTYYNRLIQEDRVIVSPIPGTTRDIVEESFKYQNDEILLVDTAGLRSNKKMKSASEFFSFNRTKEAIKNSDIVILLFDCIHGLRRDSKNILKSILEQNKGMVLVANKWDLAETKEWELFQKDFYSQMNYLWNYPVYCTSAIKGKNTLKPIKAAFEIFDNYNRTIATKDLNNFLEKIKRTKPPQGGKLKYLVQVHKAPLKFNLFLKGKHRVPANYWNYLKNQLLTHFKLSGVNVDIHLKDEKDE